MKADLFRSEVFSNRQGEWFGSIVLIRPLSFTALIVGALGVAIALCVFLAFGQYTKKSRVAGQLVPTQGVLKLHTRETAIVRERRVDEGQFVQRGDVLFVLTAERVSAGGEELNDAVAADISMRRDALLREMQAQTALRSQEAKAIEQRLASANGQYTQARTELELQGARVKVAGDMVRRNAQLIEQGFISGAQGQAKESELLAERARETALLRAVSSARADVEALEQSRLQLPLRAGAEQASAERALALLNQEAREQVGRSEMALRAPRDGYVTAIQVDTGHAAHPNLALASLVPAEGELTAHLYAPSRAIGFIEAGRPVLLRYQTYPYQKFGQYEGVVQSVSKSALSPSELATLGSAPTADPLYRIIVKLDSQTVLAYGQPQLLQAGMQLEADILLDRRRLIEWVFEPLLSLARRA